jgi:hypothetical protein
MAHPTYEGHANWRSVCNIRTPYLIYIRVWSCQLYHLQTENKVFIAAIIKLTGNKILVIIEVLYHGELQCLKA